MTSILTQLPRATCPPVIPAGNLIVPTHPWWILGCFYNGFDKNRIVGSKQSEEGWLTVAVGRRNVNISPSPPYVNSPAPTRANFKQPERRADAEGIPNKRREHELVDSDLWVFACKVGKNMVMPAAEPAIKRLPIALSTRTLKLPRKSEKKTRMDLRRARDYAILWHIVVESGDKW